MNFVYTKVTPSHPRLAKSHNKINTEFVTMVFNYHANYDDTKTAVFSFSLDGK